MHVPGILEMLLNDSYYYYYKKNFNLDSMLRYGREALCQHPIWDTSEHIYSSEIGFVFGGGYYFLNYKDFRLPCVYIQDCIIYSKRKENLHARSVCCVLCCSRSSPPDSSVHGIFQARTLKWVAISSSRGSSWLRDRTYISCISCTSGRVFTTEPPVRPHVHGLPASISSRLDCKGETLIP